MRSRPIRVLVVEDDFYTATDLAESLSAKKVEVVGPFSSVTQAMPFAANEILDAAILDINLCGASVYPLAEYLQRRNIPFIFATGYEREVLPEQFRDVPHVEKPYNNAVCLKKVLELAQGAE